MGWENEEFYVGIQEPLPGGLYLLGIRSVEMTSTSTGKDQWKVKYEVINENEFEGRGVYGFYMYLDDPDNEWSLKRLGQTMVAAELLTIAELRKNGPAFFYNKAGKAKVEELVGKKVGAFVDDGKPNQYGKVFSEIKNIATFEQTKALLDKKTAEMTVDAKQKDDGGAMDFSSEPASVDAVTPDENGTPDDNNQKAPWE